MEKAYFARVLDNGDIRLRINITSHQEIIEAIEKELEPYKPPQVKTYSSFIGSINKQLELTLHYPGGFAGACSIAHIINKIEHVISTFAKKVEDSEHYVSKIEQDLETKGYGRLLTCQPHA